MEPNVFDLREFFAVLKRRSTLICGIVGVCVTLFLIAALVFPKKYKSSMVITIYNKYFHLPLVKDFTSEISDSRELRIQRESIVRQSLNDEFLDELGDKYAIYKHAKDHPYHHGERQEFLKQIEILTLNDATYEVSYIAKDPDTAYHVVSSILEQVTKTLVVERRKTITNLRDAIRKNVEGIGFMMKHTADPTAADRPELLIQERERILGQIQALTTQYTDKHPAVAKLKARVSVINRWLNSAGKVPQGENTMIAIKPLVGGEPTEAETEVYADLVQKLNYLNIALDVESNEKPSYLGVIEEPFKPYKVLWPKKSVFVVWGLMTGLLISSFVVFVYEYLLRTNLKRITSVLKKPKSILGSEELVEEGALLPSAMARMSAGLQREEASSPSQIG